MNISVIMAAIALPLSGHASAAIVSTYWKTDAPSSNPVPAHDYLDGVTPSTFASHGAISLDPQMGSYGWTSTLNQSNYIGFSVGADDGFKMTLTSLDFKSYPSAGFLANMIAIGSYRWGYRVDDGGGFGAWVFDKTYTSADSDFSNAFAQKTWDFTDFSTTGTVEFGLFASSLPDDVPLMNATSDRLNLNGTVNAVPEPSVALLGALGGAAFLRRRRQS